VSREQESAVREAYDAGQKYLLVGFD